MNIYWMLFLTFLEIGAVSFGGGYGMIALMNEKAVGYGWLTNDQFLNMIAVSESTPGPIAVNIATFVGASEGGLLGALCATLGIVLPSFIIILLIAALVGNLLKYAGVNAVINGMKPAVTGIIFATALTMFTTAVFAVEKVGDKLEFSLAKSIIFVVVAVCCLGYKKIFKKQINPILLILISACLGMVICPFLS
ncbi:MAG: chromate transporter [Clostridia bacterium]|nr:chromate transporter [Clostridia bacterium]